MTEYSSITAKVIAIVLRPLLKFQTFKQAQITERRVTIDDMQIIWSKQIQVHSTKDCRCKLSLWNPSNPALDHTNPTPVFACGRTALSWA